MRDLIHYVAAGSSLTPPATRFFPADGDHLGALLAEFPETCPVHLRESLGIDAPNWRFDTVVTGRRTYEPPSMLG